MSLFRYLSFIYLYRDGSAVGDHYSSSIVIKNNHNTFAFASASPVQSSQGAEFGTLVTTLRFLSHHQFSLPMTIQLAGDNKQVVDLLKLAKPSQAKISHCVRTACILRTQRLGYSPKNTCHLFTRGKTERCQYHRVGQVSIDTSGCNYNQQHRRRRTVRSWCRLATIEYRRSRAFERR